MLNMMKQHQVNKRLRGCKTNNKNKLNIQDQQRETEESLKRHQIPQAATFITISIISYPFNGVCESHAHLYVCTSVGLTTSHLCSCVNALHCANDEARQSVTQRQPSQWL